MLTKTVHLFLLTKAFFRPQSLLTIMSSDSPIAQGKTKAIFRMEGNPANVRVKSLDSLTAFNAKRKDEIAEKGEIANKTTCNVFRFLNECGVKTHFVKQISDSEFEAKHCAMIPIEWVSRRVATGSFLKRNPGVKEGYTFTPPLIETFFKVYLSRKCRNLFVGRCKR
jgi:phosphoribosylaminoimidazole carboxylase/phosphoribosylaminoimidazole-succinocarboxamide synthase